MATRAAHPRSPLAAYVLHRYDWSESSLILDLFTREQGRLAVAAKGAKRPYSQLRGVLLPFQRLHVTLGRGRGGDPAQQNVQTLRGADWAGGAAMLTGGALFAGFYVNELLMKLLARHDPHVALFDAYAQTLLALAGGDDVQAEAALRAFELTLLQRTGVLPELNVVTQTQQPVRADAPYALLPDAGVAPAGTGSGADALRGAALIGLQAALEHGSVAALQQACRACLPALKGQLRGLIQHQLGGSPLRTREVMAQLQVLARVRASMAENP